ncbi:hypothetical protein [Phyllobacterium pellucidum]|uniref:hypothetical protein n=1 Tax=Phyllobacterium pellucidum TaxID=2740464 RepID=UPI001D13391B|nr:hypothetical protein [Phyllobacterium sp. T1018]UGY08313.1 hypothetical protein LLE51_009570 [Phyllobacterium sp. T1018]
MSYGMSARDYLRRAESCLNQNNPRHLFYAAFELRCAVEARMQQYLESWDHVSKKQKQGWEINKLGSTMERAFKTGDRVMRWRVEDEHTGETLVVHYYTPVTKRLQSNAKRLGDYLHAPKKYHSETDEWWSEFRNLLDEMVSQLRTATTGTLLGPALKKGNHIHMTTDIPPETNIERIYGKGVLIKVRVDYHDKLPEILEKEAVVWKRNE